MVLCMSTLCKGPVMGWFSVKEFYSIFKNKCFKINDKAHQTEITNTKHVTKNCDDNYEDVSLRPVMYTSSLKAQFL
jgi:hypothetical protein